MDEMHGYVGNNTAIRNVKGADTSKIYHNARVSDSVLREYASIGDFSTVKESFLDERCMVQRNNDIWRMQAGRFTYVGRMSIVRSTKIGHFCALADLLAIGCDNHDYHMISTHPFWHDPLWGIATDQQFASIYHEKEYEEPCEIGNDVWMGSGVNICRGVRIGNGCVIGAGAVITHDLDPYSVVVGVPGKVIKKRFDDSTIERLEKTRWWDLPTEVLTKNLFIFRGGHLDEVRLEKLEELCADLQNNE